MPKKNVFCSCDDYKWLQEQLYTMAVLAWNHGQGLKENRGHFKYCPYCGKGVKRNA